MLNYFRNLRSKPFCKYPSLLLALMLFVSFAQGSTCIPQNTEQQSPSATTLKALNRIIKLNSEVANNAGAISELILKGSYIQDTLYSYLLLEENVDEFNRGMELIDEEMKNFRGVATFISHLYNFYKGTVQESNPQLVNIEYNGEEVSGYLNTFKLNRHLTSEEREFYFFQEYEQFMQDCIELPFDIDGSNIQTLKPDTLYNFVLLPDGTIRAALESIGEREYHVRNESVLVAFTHPNHTILAGGPDQAVVTAGAFIIHRECDKQLFFVSCKSGHFQPYYTSLHSMRSALSKLGINPFTVISVNDVDLSQSILKTYKSAKIPLFISTHDNLRLFEIAQKRWNDAYASIDKEMLLALSMGDYSVIDSELVETLKKQRAESTYMRSAYRLFSTEHTSPLWFSEFVKQFGKLKDLIKHYSRKELNYEKIKAQAQLLISLMNDYDSEKSIYHFKHADTYSFFYFYNFICSQIEELLQRESLNKEEFHNLKKLSREQCAFFLYLSEEVKLKSKGFFLYRTCAESFYQINDLMAKSDYIYAPEKDGEVQLIVPKKIVNLLSRNLDHLSIAPPRFPLKFDDVEISSLVNCAKNVFTSAYFTNQYLQRTLHSDDGSTFDFEVVHAYLEWLLKDAEVGRHAFIFFDISHQSNELYDRLIAKTEQLLQACVKRDFTVFGDEAAEFNALCCDAPIALNSYVKTDQKSLNHTLATYLSDFEFIQHQDFLSEELAEHVAESVFAFRDLMDLCRRDSILKHDKGNKDKLPTVCYDVLEEQSNILAEELQAEKCFVVTPKMKLAAEIITSRVDTSTL